jgi:hypothetical protein
LQRGFDGVNLHRVTLGSNGIASVLRAEAARVDPVSSTTMRPAITYWLKLNLKHSSKAVHHIIARSAETGRVGATGLGSITRQSDAVLNHLSTRSFWRVIDQSPVELGFDTGNLHRPYHELVDVAEVEELGGGRVVAAQLKFESRNWKQHITP